MKIIDLLNKIANGEEVPKKIRFDNTNWNKRCGEKYTYYVNDNDSDLFIYFFRKNLTFNLNDEVEILEEEKKIPEKLTDILRVDDLIPPINENMYKIWTQTIKNQNKINEIISYLDYLKSKGE